MKIVKRLRYPIFLVFLCFLFSLTISAQSNIILTIAVPVPEEVFITEEIIELFESQHPGTNVEIKTFARQDYRLINPVEIGGHLYTIERYAELADVLPIDIFASENFSFEATRAGFFLNLQPFISDDSDFAPEEYPSSVLRAFQWDNGFWAIPSGMFGRYIVYNTARFDEEGLEYPQPDWTLDDFANAARQLTTYNTNGTVDVPGMELSQGGLRWFVYALALQADVRWFQMNSDEPEELQLTFYSEKLETILQQLRDLHDEGVLHIVLPGVTNSTNASISTGLSLQVIGQYLDEAPDTMGLTTFPGNRTGVEVTGFAVSSGTANPTLAYELATFLSKIPEVALANTDFPARLLSDNNETVDTLRTRAGLGIVPEDIFDFMFNGFEDAINRSELHYSTYIITSLYTSIVDRSQSVGDYLQELEELAKNNLELVNGMEGQVEVTIEPIVLEQEGVIRFGYGSYNPTTSSRLSNLAFEFAEADSAVTQVMVEEYDWNAPIDILAETYDCFYRPHSTPMLNTSVVMSLQSFVSNDLSFDTDDYFPTILDRVTFDGELMGLPAVIQPMVIWYDGDRLFDSSPPSNSWTFDDFSTFIRNLPADSAAFQAESLSSNYIIALMLANGANIIDQNEGYFGYTLTSDLLNEMDEIEAVLDLVKERFVYEQLTAFGSGDIGRVYTEPMSSDFVGNFGGRFLEHIDGLGFENYHAVLFPRGDEYIPLVYNIGVLYISANTEKAQDCYNWISEISKHPELLVGLPVTFSQLNDLDGPGFSEDIIEIAYEISNIIGNDNTIHLRAPFGPSDPVQFIQTGILNVVFDDYILNGIRLENKLTWASQLLDNFNSCVDKTVDAVNRTSDNRERNIQAANCIRRLDDTLWFLQSSP